MSNFFYYGDKDIVQGPFTELKVQRWYLNSYFSSDARFQITQSGKFDPDGRICTLGELIDLNGKINPFYFSIERENREKKMEENLAQLMQVVESIRTKNLCTHRSEKDTIIVLQTQVAELVESNTDLRKRLDALSHQRETSPVTTQLDTKVTDLKNRVNEQEKNVGAMKKEISAVNSKCDRNESKLDKFIEKQKQTEGTVKCYDKRISDLKAAEESIKENLSACEEKSETVDCLISDVTDIQATMKGLREELSTDRSKLTSIHEGLDKVQNDLKDLVKNEKELRSEIDSVREETKKAAQEQHVKDEDRLAKGAPPGMKSATPPPWEVESEKAAVAVEVKEQAGLPWDGTGKANKTEKAPFETEKAAGDAGLKKEDDLPWNRTEVKTKESAPWESREEPPSSAMSSKKKDTLVEAEKAGNGLSIEQKQKKTEEVAVRSEKAATDVKPVSRVKDWAAICRELSDDEEEVVDQGKEQATTANLILWSDTFIRDVVELLRIICAALETGNMSWLERRGPAINYPEMRKFYLECDRTAPHYGRIREAILKELRQLAAQTFCCKPCVCSVTTPRMLLHHLVYVVHELRSAQGEMVPNAQFFAMLEMVKAVLFHFIASDEELKRDEARQSALNARGRALASRRGTREQQHRPTYDFCIRMIVEVTKVAPTHFTLNNNFLITFDPAQHGARLKEMTTSLKEYFACKQKKRNFDQKFEKHMAEGLPVCAVCAARFESVDEYYQHMTTYEHANKDRSLFGMLVWIWKGLEYWDANL